MPRLCQNISTKMCDANEQIYSQSILMMTRWSSYQAPEEPRGNKFTRSYFLQRKSPILVGLMEPLTCHKAETIDQSIDIELEQALVPSSECQTPNFWSFDELNQQAVLALVDAHLRVRFRAQMGPMEDRLRAEIVDIVRKCQSAVAASFQSSPEPLTSLVGATQPSLDLQRASQPFMVGSSNQASEAQAPMAANISPSFLQEPPFVDFDDVSLVQQLRPVRLSQSQINDSGYGSQDSRCDCSCHTAPGSSRSPNGE